MIGRRSVRATRSEKLRVLPGDELIPDAIASLTHATTIRGDRGEVWPWLAQMGAGSRAGWYSYDWLDNGRQHSARRIVPELQGIAEGTLFPAIPGNTDGFEVLKLDPGRSLVLGFRPRRGAEPMVTWAFVLEAGRDHTTRLTARARGSRAYPFYGLPPAIGNPIIRFVHFIMERKQLLGIAARVEATHARTAHVEAA